jgi:hypothetical protein
MDLKERQNIGEVEHLTQSGKMYKKKKTMQNAHQSKKRTGGTLSTAGARNSLEKK